MAKKKDKNKAQGGRLTFPLSEEDHDWLPMLLEGYHITDQGVAKGIGLMEKQGHDLACAKGCSSCCTTHRNIPSYPLELVGITWYCTEIIEEPFREALKLQLMDKEEGGPCVFLIDGVCSIHPLRPMACRQFNVFNKKCDEGEDAYFTRRKDVLTPLKKYTNKAFSVMMPFYGVKDRAQRRHVVENGLMHTMAKSMREMNWSSVARKMIDTPLKLYYANDGCRLQESAVRRSA